MKRAIYFLSRFYPVILLVLIELILFFINYRANTFLVGWDNLYPELNFKANLGRNLFSVWQEYRGLGLVDGMAYGANLPHTLFIYLLSLIFPLNFLRYAFVFLMHFLGGAGMYIFLKKTILKKSQRSKTVAFISAVFYLLNISTVQFFYAPLEVFLVHFAFLPWLLHFLFNYLEKSTKKNLLIFSIFSVLSLPQGFVPQIFLVYLILVSLILITFLVRFGRKYLGKTIRVLVLILAINSYWLFPCIYSVIDTSGVIVNTKINQMSNENVYLKNKARGNLQDVLLFKGFMLDEIEPINGRFDYIMKDWRNYTQTPFFWASSFLFLSIEVLGFIYSLKEKEKYSKFFIIPLAITFFFLATDAPLLGGLTEFLRNHLFLFREAFRFSFTKFGIAFMFCSVIYLSYGLDYFFSFLEQRMRPLLLICLPVILLIGIFIYTFPSFNSNFLYPTLRVNIPQEYLQTFDFFKKQPLESRVALLPEPSFWSWQYYQWGTRGSGFIWYGISQPTLDRAFNPWSQANENYYWEVSYALYSNNLDLLYKVLQKYQVDWIVLDKNIIDPGSSKSLYFDKTERLVTSLPEAKLVSSFGNIEIYKINLNPAEKDFVLIKDNLPQVSPTYTSNNYDRGYADNGFYITSKGTRTSQSSIYYPFRSLFTNKNQEDQEFNLEDKQDYLVFKRDIPVEYQSLSLNIPEYSAQDLTWIDPDGLNKTANFKPTSNYNGKTLEVVVPKVRGYLAAQIDPLSIVRENISLKCNPEGRIETQGNSNNFRNVMITENGKNYLRLYSKNTDNCSASFWTSNIPHRVGYLVTVQSRNLEGKSLNFWIENLETERAEVNVYLPEKKEFNTSSFIIPPMEQDGLGYSLHFDNVSIGNTEAVNDLGEVMITPIPYDYLSAISFSSGETTTGTSEDVSFIDHPNPSYYKVLFNESKIKNNSTLVLSQAYDKGWIAFSMEGWRITPLEHVLVNNWENGWKLNSGLQNQINILFVPQLLEFIGFAFLGISFFYVLKFFPSSH